MVSTVKSTVSSVATKVTTAAKKVVNDAKVAVQKATTAVVNVVKNVVNTVVNTVTTAVGNAVSYVENGVKSVASYVEKATTEVRNNVTTAYNSVKSYVAEKVQTVTTKASELWEKAEDLGQKVMARCETAVAETVEKASRWWQDTKESVKTAVEKTQNFVEKIGDSIKEGLNECATKAKEGLKCLAEGAKGVWNAVTNFVEEHPFIATGILIVGLAALTFFTGGAASAIFLAATKGAIMGAISGFGSGVVTAGVKKLVHGDSYSFDDAVHDVGKSTFGGALFGAITGGALEAGKQLWSKFGGKITSALSKSTKRGESEFGLYRKVANTGEFNGLQEPMQIKNVKNIAQKAGIGLDDVKVKIDRNAELMGKGIYGYTDGKTITLYPDAFTDTETLVKTLGHERIHVYQTSIFGKPTSSEILQEFEKAAFASESSWWQFFQNGGL